MIGYIYAIECSGRIKIGFSEKPEKRFSKIASDAPFPCVLLGYWPGNRADELAAQDRFNALRVHGEWFASTQDLLAFIAENVIVRDMGGKRFVVTDADSPLSAWRKRQKMTQTQIGELIGVCTSSICQLESGQRGASLPIAVKIHEITGGVVPLESLLPIRETSSPDLYDGMKEART